MWIAFSPPSILLEMQKDLEYSCYHLGYSCYHLDLFRVFLLSSILEYFSGSYPSSCRSFHSLFIKMLYFIYIANLMFTSGIYLWTKVVHPKTTAATHTYWWLWSGWLWEWTWWLYGASYVWVLSKPILWG